MKQPRARDGCEWWPTHRTRQFARALAERLTTRDPPTAAVMHSSWCARSSDGRRRCTCVPVTLVFGATA